MTGIVFCDSCESYMELFTVIQFVQFCDWPKSLHLVLQMRQVFPFLGTKVPNWFSRIKELSYNRNWQEVFALYHEVKKAGGKSTDPLLFPPVLKACLGLSFRYGRSIHSSIIKQGYESLTSISNSVLDFYVKSRALDSAMGVFHCMRNRDSVSWNIMIHGYLDREFVREGLWLFTQAKGKNFEPNTSTLVLVMQACHTVGDIHDGMKVHAYTVRSGFGTILEVQNSLLSVYTDIEMTLAQKLFDEMLDRDVISWTVMIGGYVRSNEAGVALRLFKDMLSEVQKEMDGRIVVSVLNACTSFGDSNVGSSFHGLAIRECLCYDLFVGNSLIDMYSKFGDVDSALKMFTEMPLRNIVSWNSILSGFVYNGKHSEAVLILPSMGKAGIVADGVTLVNLLQICKYLLDSSLCKIIHSAITRRGYELNDLIMNTLIDAYAKCNLIIHSRSLFRQMKVRDAATWSTMIAGFTHSGMPVEAIAAFQEMNRAQQKPNFITILNLLEACSVYAELKVSKWAHAIATRIGLASQAAVGTAILDMYAKCGAIEASRKVFDQIPAKNIVSWSAMIAAFGMNGRARDALALLAEIEVHGLKPNSVTMLSALASCSHGGLVTEGLILFKKLVEEYKDEVRFEHYSCILDLLARAGKLNDAMELIESMPDAFKAGASAWGSILSGCRNYKNSEIGAGALSHVLELEPSTSAGYLLACSMYAASGSWIEAATIRNMVKERGVRVPAGYSLLRDNNTDRPWMLTGKVDCKQLSDSNLSSH